jgi:hypothetical protein
LQLCSSVDAALTVLPPAHPVVVAACMPEQLQ